MLTEQQKRDFKWPVTGSIDIAAPAARVWEVISGPGNLLACQPFCAANPVNKWPGRGSRDEVHYLSGWIFERHLHTWLDGEGYELEIGRHGGSKSEVCWRITPIDAGRARLTITVYPSFFEGRPTLLRWLAHRLKVRPLLASYLDSVVRGFDWYISRGEAVPRNQFGRHAWFSARNEV